MTSRLPKEPTIRRLTLTVVAAVTVCVISNAAYAATAGSAPPTSHRLSPEARQFREQTYRTHPCLAQIIDRYENGSWDPTLDYGGGHGNTSQSYGLPQANPGTKMQSAGPLWRTDRATQLRWMIRYAVSRFGSECAALAFRQRNGWY